KNYEFAVQYRKSHPADNYVFTPQNIGEGINTSESEYFPSLTIDGKELIFTRNLHYANEDFYSSQKNKTGWDLAKPLAGDINTPQNEGAQMISLDGQWMVYAATNRRDSWGG